MRGRHCGGGGGFGGGGEVSRHFRNKKKEYLRAKIEEL